MYEGFGISKELENLANEAENELKLEFEKIDKACTKNSLKVLKAFQENRISDVHFTRDYRIWL